MACILTFLVAVSMHFHAWMFVSKSRFLVVSKVILSMYEAKGMLHDPWRSKEDNIDPHDTIRHEATSAIWQETYLSAVLRAILYSDDSYYRLAGYRKIDPITGLQGEAKFLEAVEALFWKGKRDDRSHLGMIQGLTLILYRLATWQQA